MGNEYILVLEIIMAGYSDKKLGYGFDTSGMYLENFLRSLPENDPVFSCLILPEVLQKNNKDTPKKIHLEKENLNL